MFCKSCGKEIFDKAAVCIHCGVLTNGASLPLKQPEKADKPPKKLSKLCLAGFIVAVASILLGFLAVYINGIRYTGVNFQYFAAVPLVVSLIISIIGTAKGKKSGERIGFGIAGIAISGGFFVLFALFLLLKILIKYFAAVIFMFVIAML
ncbi:MAG: hypothetical protein K2N52_03870 [Clostridia bacterium]|nr:hypothetical protein [Clostridia bacterium]